MASRSIDSSGVSRRRLTLQHSGGRSPGWIVPVRRCWTTRFRTCQSCSVLPGQFAADRALAERDRNPQNLLPASGQRLLQRYPQRLKPHGAEPVDMPDDQAPLALGQFAEGPCHPAMITGLGGVQHMERARRVAAPVDSPQQRQLAGSGLALGSP
jgi:hypothetical protein